MITEVVSSFAVLFVMVLILKLFVYYTNWVAGLDINPMISLALLISGAWALMDAPDIVQRLLGIDAGLRSGYQAMMGAYAGAKLAGGAGNMVAKGVSKAADGVSGALSFGKGMMSGGKGIMNENALKQPPMPKDGKANSDDHKVPTLGRNMDKNAQNQPGMPSGPNNTSTADIKDEHSTIKSGESQSSGNGNNDFHSQNEIPESMNSSSDSDGYIPEGYGNPYEKPGLFGGSRAGQRRANFKARAFNSGVAMRNRISRGASGIKKTSMASARFVASPVKSSQNLGAMATAKAMSVSSQLSQATSNLIESAVAKASEVGSQIVTPLGESVSAPIADVSASLSSTSGGESIVTPSSSSESGISASLTGSNTSESRSVSSAIPSGGTRRSVRRSQHVVNNSHHMNPRRGGTHEIINEIDVIERNKAYTGRSSSVNTSNRIVNGGTRRNIRRPEGLIGSQQPRLNPERISKNPSISPRNVRREE